MHIREKIEKCLKEGEKGERHKGLKEIPISKDKVKGHINKAKHNYSAMMAFQKAGFSDWSASAAFYCLYHSLLAILSKKGYESRNQNCTFAFVNGLILKGEISLTEKELNEIYNSDITENLEHSDKILDIRENMQYSIKTAMENEEFLALKKRTDELFNKIRGIIEQDGQ